MAHPQPTIKDLLEAGAHFGHQTRRWNPKMKRFIFEARNGLYIIDLAKTLQQIRNAVEIVKEIVGKHRSILFVGTKKQAKSVVRELAEESGEFYVCERWLGGMLTNLQTIRQSIKKLEKIEKTIATGSEGLTKKEISLLTKDQIKLERNLSGVRSMRKTPGLVIVVDPSKEHIAVAEANKLGIPVMGLVDTNCDPDPIQYVIACNDDALKSIKVILQTLAQAIIDKKNEMLVTVGKGDEEEGQEEGDEEVAEEDLLVAKYGSAEDVEKPGARSSQMSQPVTPTLIKELRDRTGVGMGKCKEALEEAKGDIELAISNLRKAGIAGAVKKEGRSTNEGLILATENDKVIALVEINAETDFVVKNDRFQQFARNIVAEVAATRPASIEAFLHQKYSKDPSLTIDQYRATIVQTIGENIQIKRLALIPKSADKSIGTYTHLGGKIVTLVEISGSSGFVDLAKDIAMHVAAASPEYLSPEKVPASVISHEKEIVQSQIMNKPANIIDKIVEGKLNSFYDAACLIRQKYIKDDSLSITELVNKHGKENGKTLSVTHFLRWNVGQ